MTLFTKLFGRRLFASALTAGAAFALGTASAQTPADEGAERVRELLKNERLLSGRFGGWDMGDLHRRAALARSAEMQSKRDVLATTPGLLIAGPTWTSLGPTSRPINSGLSDDSGLVAHIAVDPNNSQVIFVATAGGGFQAGAVAIAPSDSKRVYAGTGCADASSFILGVPRSIVGYPFKSGIGVLISTDGGDNWRVSKNSPGGAFWDLLVDPANPDVLTAATDQGVQRSINGGDDWTPVLQNDQVQWATCLSRAKDPKIIFAGTWGNNLPGSVWKSIDGGETWTEKANGLPGDAKTRTRVEVAVAPSKPDRVYAIVSGNEVQIDLARSDDGGENWTPLHVGKDVNIVDVQGNFAIVLSVDPKNPDVVYAGGFDSWKSENGGKSWARQSDWLGVGHPYLHADQHAHAHASDGTIYFGNDGGIFESTDGGKSFRALNKGFDTFLANVVCHDPADVERLVLGAQDNSSSVRVKSAAGVWGTEWKEAFTGDGYGCAFHPTDSQQILASVQELAIYRSDDGGTSWKPAGLPEKPLDGAPFRTLLLQHPTTSDRVFTHSKRKVWVTDNFAASWSLDSKTMPIIHDIQDLDVSRSTPARMVLVDKEGRVVVSENGGASWRKKGNTPEYWYTSAVRFDRKNPSRIWVATNDPKAEVERLFVSEDGGAKWKAISRTGQTASGGLPDLPILSFEPDRRDSTVLWAGSFIGLYRSANGGATWERYGQGLPGVPIMGITPVEDGSRLRVATFGLGVWEIATPAATGPAAVAVPRPADAPQAAFTFSPASPRPARAVHFEDDSKETPTSFSWDFGDGKTSEDESPVHIFDAPGTYTVTLTATNASGSSAVSKPLVLAYPGTGTGDVLTFLLPVILTSSGAGGSAFSTELTLTNRSGKALDLTFRARGTFEASSTYTLEPGQEAHPDVFMFLRDTTGMPVPRSKPLVASLRIETRGASFPGQFGALARVTTPPNEEQARQGVRGRFGLSFSATALSTGAAREAVVYGLQQTSSVGTSGTRSNLACVHAGPTSTSPIRLEVTYHDGSTGEDDPSKDFFDLLPFQWKQLSAPLAPRGISSGWASIQKVSGEAQFVCYGVLNDNVNSDGAFVPMVVADAPSAATSVMVPVVVGTPTFRSELTLSNRTNDLLDFSLALVSTISKAPEFGRLTLLPGEQRVFPDVFKELPAWGIYVPPGTFAGAMYVSLETGSADVPNDRPTREAENPEERVSATSAFAGVRTYATQAGGLLSAAYGSSPLGEGADTEGWVYGLQQTGERDRAEGTRSNLAVVHALNGEEGPLGLEVTYFGPDGRELGKDPECSPCTLEPGEWRQFSEPLARYGIRAGYARVRRVSGTDQFIAYGVLNDQLNGDGSYLAMNVP